MKLEEMQKIIQILRESLSNNVGNKLTSDLATGIMVVTTEHMSKLVEPEPEDGKPERTNIDTE